MTELPQRTFRFCRLCFSKTLVFTSLLSPEKTTMLEYLDIKLFPSKNNEEMVCCTICDLDLKRSYKTRQKFITTQANLEYTFVQSIKEEADEPEVENHFLYILVEDDVDLKVTTCEFCNTEIKCEDLMSHLKLHAENPKTPNRSIDDIGRVSSTLVPIAKISKNSKLQRKRTLKVTPLKDSNKEHPKSQIKEIELRNTQGATEDTKNECICPICCREFSTKGKCQSHIQIHARKVCPICDKEITVSNLARHIANHSSGMQVCDTCGRTFGNAESLRAHMFHTHRNVIHKCEGCNKIFAYKPSLLNHMIKEHSKTRNFVCELCGKKFFVKSDLNKHHRMTHLKERNYICEFCNKGFSAGYALKTHVRQHTDETPFHCDICGEGFRQNVSLRGHKKSKHNIVEPITSICHYCGKGFGSEWALGVHTRLHPEAVD